MSVISRSRLLLLLLSAFTLVVVILILHSGTPRQSIQHETYQSFNESNDGLCFRNFFHDILLIIVYHYPFYTTIPLVRSSYDGAFPHIIVCGATEDTSGKNKIMVADINPRGFLTQECVGKSIRLYPNFRGYLMVNDDMLVNWWNFAKLSKDKIWQGARVKYENAYMIGQKSIPDDWFWKLPENGARSCEKAYSDILHLKTDRVFGKDVSKLLKTNFLNGRNKTMCFRTWSDFVYIPGKLSKKFELLCSYFFKHKVFLEIAFPTIFSFLVKWEDTEKVYGVYLPDTHGFIDFTLPENVWPQYSERIPFLHPVKIHGKEGVMNRNEIKRRVLPYARRFLSC